MEAERASTSYGTGARLRWLSGARRAGQDRQSGRCHRLDAAPPLTQSAFVRHWSTRGKSASAGPGHLGSASWKAMGTAPLGRGTKGSLSDPFWISRPMRVCGGAQGQKFTRCPPPPPFRRRLFSRRGPKSPAFNVRPSCATRNFFPTNLSGVTKLSCSRSQCFKLRSATVVKLFISCTPSWKVKLFTSTCPNFFKFSYQVTPYLGRGSYLSPRARQVGGAGGAARQQGGTVL